MVDIVLQGPGKNALSTGVMRAALFPYRVGLIDEGNARREG